MDVVTKAIYFCKKSIILLYFADEYETTDVEIIKDILTMSNVGLLFGLARDHELRFYLNPV